MPWLPQPAAASAAVTRTRRPQGPWRSRRLSMPTLLARPLVTDRVSRRLPRGGPRRRPPAPAGASPPAFGSAKVAHEDPRDAVDDPGPLRRGRLHDRQEVLEPEHALDARDLEDALRPWRPLRGRGAGEGLRLVPEHGRGQREAHGVGVGRRLGAHVERHGRSLRGARGYRFAGAMREYAVLSPSMNDSRETETAGPESAAPARVAPSLESLARRDLEKIFTPEDARLVRRILEFARGPGPGPFRDDLLVALDTGVTGLGHIASAIRNYPSLREKRTLGGRERSMATLIDGLVKGGEHAFEWNLPTNAVLSRAFGIAKVNFLTSLRYVVEACHGDEVPPLLEQIAAEIEEAVYTRLTEELLGSLITSPSTDGDLKRLAAAQLVELWEGRIGLTVARFAPVLRSAWQARARAVRVFGTLMGTAEILQLL